MLKFLLFKRMSLKRTHTSIFNIHSVKLFLCHQKLLLRILVLGYFLKKFSLLLRLLHIIGLWSFILLTSKRLNLLGVGTLRKILSVLSMIGLNGCGGIVNRIVRSAVRRTHLPIFDAPVTTSSKHYATRTLTGFGKCVLGN